MSRELKFRVWSVKNNCFVTNGCNMSVLLSLEYEGAINSKDIYQQYTGLKDSKGKEVYEGDITFHKNDKAYCQCIWDQERITYRWVGKNMSLPIYTRDDNMTLKEKIVGNVFEHKHLLEK